MRFCVLRSCFLRSRMCVPACAFRHTFALHAALLCVALRIPFFVFMLYNLPLREGLPVLLQVMLRALPAAVCFRTGVRTGGGPLHTALYAVLRENPSAAFSGSRGNHCIFHLFRLHSLYDCPYVPDVCAQRTCGPALFAFSSGLLSWLTLFACSLSVFSNVSDLLFSLHSQCAQKLLYAGDCLGELLHGCGV